MDLNDQIRNIATRISTVINSIQTEEATKNAIIMPFIQALGYNVFDPLEVTPELIADVGTKKGEKVDYAILKDEKPIMLFECKKAGSDLGINQASQLFRYFHVTEARFGILTNGTHYRFFTDLEQPNKMDDHPFLEFNIFDFKETEIEEIKKFSKSAFDVDLILSTATDLKYTRTIQSVLSSWFQNPPEELIRLAGADMLSGRRFTTNVKEQFASITKKAFQQLINEKINERLRVALNSDDQIQSKNTLNNDRPVSTNIEVSTVETTADEIEGLHIIRSILKDTVSPKRIVMRDAQSYCAILLDDNNRKPVCRLRFNNSKKLNIGFMIGKEEVRVEISDVYEIYAHEEKIKQAVLSYT